MWSWPDRQFILLAEWPAKGDKILINMASHKQALLTIIKITPINEARLDDRHVQGKLGEGYWWKVETEKEFEYV